MHKTIGLVFAAATLAAAAPAHTATGNPNNYSALYVFGDSLVDAGNISALTRGATPNASLGYFNGRFTNGYNYVDYINYQLFGSGTKASLTGGNNFAFGGARIVTDAKDAIPDINPQIGAYVAAKGPVADPNALYILNAGGNDIFALGRFAGGDPTQLLPFTNPADYINAIVNQYVGAVQTLNSLGARNILITGIPNATVPLAVQIDAQLQAALNGLTLAPGTELYRFSYIDFFNRVATDPGSLGLPALRTDKSCIELRAQATGCAGIFSFDGTHPTAAVQSALFRDIVRQFGVSGVPEPANWGLMIAGFALAGVAVRRRSAGPALAA
ncbi:PEPxxWA-CTERM sorting domain-containing protein [Sphingomonas sp. ID1715]|uniref:SGNH/GDSL hydrolase family protein n=1 Tax=Sphingomonas sp. ID1715 TaxID=1656898 RepID=UPI00148931AD|nr:SGNH/GDSL hydrolase family protein [Sphingomonas sp. ID1715]NNM76060.1 PEPxxWA-CTERM sorting domain-containing protein [Sphingomonas sp. ID1715]